MTRRLLAIALVVVLVVGGVALGIVIGNRSSSSPKGVTTSTNPAPTGKGGHRRHAHQGRHGGRGRGRSLVVKNPHGSYTLTNQTFKCRGKVAPGTTVTVTIDDGSHTDGIHLDQGCTGGPLVVHIKTDGADGVKVHTGAHDLLVHGDVRCAGKHGQVHQDGVQAMGGARVTFEGFRVNCPTGNNGGFWVNAGRNRNSVPTDIICDHCDLFERNAALHVGPNSIRSGARNSRLHHGTSPSSPSNCARVDHSAVDPVASNNTCV